MPSPSRERLKSDLAAYARSLGFERVGITSAEPLEKDEAFLKNWLAEGRFGEMDYLAREPERRARPKELLPGARSVIAMAMSYPLDGRVGVSACGRIGETAGSDAVTPERRHADTYGSEARIARYAWGRDYHRALSKRLESFMRYLEALSPGAESRSFVDTGPLLERALARRAGLGFVGKNTMLITRGLGSWVYLAHVITTLDLPSDEADGRSCGECRLCIDACPTEAIAEPFVLDARRCIAYLTIEQDGRIDEGLRGKTGGWVFGCDICQEVCPHNLRPRYRHRRPQEMTTLNAILAIKDETEFSALFTGTSLMRAGRESLLRNACLAAANLNRTDLTPRLQDLSRNDSSQIVREHASWALEKLSAARASPVPPASIPDQVRS